MSDDADRSGVARAGAAFAARRRELGISQRRLHADKVVSGKNLIPFEKGRQWPQAATRARLEDAVGWPPGALERLRTGGSVEPEPPSVSWEGVPLRLQAYDTGQSGLPPDEPLIANAVGLAVGSAQKTIEMLPGPENPRFAEYARAMVADLRGMNRLIGRALRFSGPSDAVLQQLVAVRELYDDLVGQLATTPGALLGERLYAARVRSRLSADDAAVAAGVDPAAVAAAENDETVTDDDRAKIEALIANLDAAGG